MQQATQLNRRNFLKATSLSSAALVLGLSSKGREILAADDAAASFTLSPYIIIEKSGKITLMNPKPEMGQGTFQSVPALMAEELEVSLDQVTILQTNGNKEFGRQVSGGSSSVRGNYMQLRKVGASAKEMLLKAASQQWNVPVTECYAEGGKIFHKPNGKSLAYGDLAEAASKLVVPQNPALKDPKDFKILGKKSPRPDVPLKVSGRAVFGIDVEVPGMVYASVQHCLVFDSKLVSFDDSETLKIKGVQKAVQIQRMLGSKNKYDAVAVVADNYWSAYQGRLALNIKWDHQGNDKFNSKEYEQSLRDLAKTEGKVVHTAGDFDGNFAGAPVKVEAFYETPIVSHSPMEPMNCIAHWQGDNKAELWVSAQGPDLVKGEIFNKFGIPRENVTVHIFFNGGAFGRRLYPDFASEALSISKAVGKPVKLIWTREDDTQLGPFRAMTFSALKAGLSADGKPVAFQHKVISPSMGATMDEKRNETGESSSMTEGISDQKYELPNMKNEYVFSEIHVPMAAWRSVTSSTLAFAHECFIDEMAVKAGKDPMDFRLSMLTTDSACKKVLAKLKEVSHWNKPLPKGWGRGVAQYEFFAGIAGYVVEVSSTKDGKVKPEKVYCVIDLGTVVNPDTVDGQIEGAMTMALTAATKDGITFVNGETEQTNFHNNQMVRINEVPQLEVHILAEGGPVIKGVGEPGMPPFAPALANAVFAATGKRIRRLPFDLNKV